MNLIEQIPSKLFNDKLRFILLRSNDKIPIETSWQTSAQYKYDDVKIKKHLENLGNVGLLCAKGINLTIDFDDEFIEKKIAPRLPPTFTTKSGSGRLHKHFLCVDGENIKISDKNKNTLVDIQGDRKQVVIPPSTHPNGNKYCVVDDVPLAEISMGEIKALFGDYISINTKNVVQYVDKPAQAIKNSVGFERLLSDYGVDTSINPTMCPFGHKSRGGKCFWFQDDKQFAYCFNCDWGGDVISFVQEIERVDFKTAMSLLSSKYKVNLPNIVISTGQDIELKHWQAADAIMGKYTFLTISDTDCVYVYRDGVYCPLAESFIKRRCEELLNSEVRFSFVREVIESIKRRTYIELKEIETSPDILVVKNGLLNVRTKELLPHSNEFKSFTGIPVFFNVEKDCPTFKTFLGEILKQEDQQLIQEMFGYCLYSEYCWQKAFMLTGSGANGKSTLLSCLKCLIGSDNVCNIGLQALEYERFSRAELFGKLANIYPDLPSSSLENTGVFKCLTGGDRITAEKKNQQPFGFVNFAKLVFSANQIPSVKDDSDAFFRRWVIVRFEKQFINNSDPHLISKITTRDELSGILNWALEGLQRLFRTDRFSDSTTTEEIREQYTRLSNPLKCFVDDCLSFDNYDDFTTKEEMFATFAMYCRTNNLPPIKDLWRFAQQIVSFFPPHVQESQRTINNVRKKGYDCVSVKRLQGVQGLHTFSKLTHAGEEKKGEKIAPIWKGVAALAALAFSGSLTHVLPEMVEKIRKCDKKVTFESLKDILQCGDDELQTALDYLLSNGVLMRVGATEYHVVN